MNFRKKMIIGAVAAIGALGAGGGVAFAVWTVQGSGTGAGAAGVAQNLTLTAVTPAGTLYPGGPAGPVEFQVNNPNPFAVTITAVAWGTPFSTNTSNCASSNISLDANAPTTVSVSVPASSTTATGTVNGVLDLSHSAGNGCQGVPFDIPITSVTATQQ